MNATESATKRGDSLDLDDVECMVTISRPLQGVSTDPVWSSAPAGITRVTATAVLHFAGDAADTDVRRDIAVAYGYLVDLDLVDNVAVEMDQVGGEAFDVIENALFDRSIFDMLEQENDGLGAEPVYQMLLIESVTVEEPYRGQRLGPRLLSTLIDAVDGSGNSTLVLLQAMPTRPHDLTELEQRRVQKKIAASYEAIGFKRFKKNVYWYHSAYIGPESLRV